MDLNVCSRRVHDGYATIRSRGRSRPRAVYRSDSEELLKDAVGPYALPRVTNDPLSTENIHQVPRWSDYGKNKLSENYGTLRRDKKSRNDAAELRDEKIVLNTFLSNKIDNSAKFGKINGGERNERHYDTVASESDANEAKIGEIQSEIGKNLSLVQAEIIESLNNLYDTVPNENGRNIVKKRDRNETNREKTEVAPSRQPIYAVPNVPRKLNDEKFDSRLTTDGNYVPSGDLYRTTARYIEDINRNIAEIDKSYEELRSSTCTNARNSAYGVINKIPKSNDFPNDRNDDDLYTIGFHRKRDVLAPMPPISPNFGEPNENTATPIVDKWGVNNDDATSTTRFDFKVSRDTKIDGTRESVRARPNSYGKLPPKLLPRSSSMENNSSRNSIGSTTTTSSSAKSTESLYAISETLKNLPKYQDDASAKDSDIEMIVISDKRHESERSRMKIEDDLRRFCQADLRNFVDTRVCRTRSVSHGDDKSRVIRDRCKIDGRNSFKGERSDSLTLNEKEQRSRHTGSQVEANERTAGLGHSSVGRCVDLESGGKVTAVGSWRNSSARRKTRNDNGTISMTEKSSRDEEARCRNANGTIRRDRSSSRIDDIDYYDVNDDEETSLIGRNESKITISRAKTRGKKSADRSSDQGGTKKDSKAFETVRDGKFSIERLYGTLPYRRTKNSRSLHKSSEDVLEGERKRQDDVAMTPRTCTSTMDVRAMMENPRDRTINDSDRRNIDSSVFYVLDATEVIIEGQLARTAREFGKTDFEEDTASSKSASSIFRDDHFGLDTRNDRTILRNRYSATMSKSRTRHNSLESDDNDGRMNVTACQTNLTAGAFATLPRRGNCSKDQHGKDTPRRFSGNVPILEPLYEHAVSDPVKPRINDDNVIPWWELATKKYRHRSCPALQDHVVQAFEQSLSNMNQRLKQLTATAEKKDSELQELRDTIERLRKQSAEAGLNGAATNGRRHTLGDSDSGTTGCAGYSNHQGPTIARQLSADSVTSLNSLSSACSASSNRKKKGWLGSFSKKFSRARKNRHGSVSDAEDCKDGPGGDISAPNSPRLPTAAKHDHSHNHSHNSKINGQQKSPEHENPMTGSKSSSALYKKEDEDVDELKEQLRQKDLVLTDITLEALKSSGELVSLREKIAEMKNEMKNLRENNERLQRLVTSKSLTSSQSSMPTDPERRYSMTEVAYSVAALSNGDHHHQHHHHHHHHANNSDQMEDINVSEHSVTSTYNTTTTTSETVIEQDTDGKRINVAVYLGSEKSFNVNLVSGNNEEGVGEPPHCVIASVCISNKTTWDALDNTVRRCFKDYVSRVDPSTNLGLGVDYVAAYHFGEASRFTNDSQHPELLPCGYLIGHVKTIYLVLSGYSWLAVDTLIPKSIVQRLLSLLTEHRRLILCGPSGTGKNYLAGKLAHALVDADADADAKDAAAVATFNVDHKTSKELRQYLAHIAERCDSNAADELPKVIILENLQHAASLGELFSGLLGTRHSSCPAIIGTMSQATCSTTNLQLHHNFRWVLCRKDMEPVKGFLGRYLRRKLLEQQLRDTAGTRSAEMSAVVEWLPRVWLHLNKFLETHSNTDVAIGPSLFLSCPMEVAGSQVWFTDLWNYSIRPYLVEAVKEGNGEAAWEDPAQFITTSYPWIATHAVHGGRDALLRLRPEDVGYDVVTSGHNSGVGASSVKSLGSTHSDTEGDPLLNMLMRLQEAANYSSPHSNDSDSVTSMDSSHTRHSEDLSTSTSSSRGVESAL